MSTTSVGSVLGLVRTVPVVYLDSSDYSRLSAKVLPDELSRIRSSLISYAQSGQARFVFSAAHICEMAPLESKYGALAVERSDLLADLCGSNSLISFDRLLKAEFSSLTSGCKPVIEAINQDATWFPDLSGIVSPVSWAEWEKSIDDELKPYNRHQRRAARSILFKKHRPTPAMQRWLGSDAATQGLDQVLKMYPMRPQDAKILWSFTSGRATKEQAEEAFLRSLRDPRWMMRWFEQHHGKMSPIIDWLREPARKMTQKMRDIAEIAATKRMLESRFGQRIDVEAFTPSGWESARIEMIESVVHRALENVGIQSPHYRAQDIERFCPGLATAVNTLHSSLWSSVGERPRQPAESDFVDAVHAMYAPYVNLFRADRYMAPHIRKHVARSTQIVSKLEEIPLAISNYIVGC